MIQSWYTKSHPSSGVSGDNALMTTGMGPRRVGRVEQVAVSGKHQFYRPKSSSLLHDK